MIRKMFFLPLLVAGLALGRQTAPPEKDASLKADLARQIDG